MAGVSSTMLALDTAAPDFSLPDTTGQLVSLADYKQAPATLVAFLCNHCPYVKHIANQFAEFVREYQAKGVAVIGINANDVSTHPDDSPQKMAEEAKKIGYTFPYLYDETQEVAKSYRAACTPDFFLFDKDHKLAYRGQFDGSRPDNKIAVTGQDLRMALDAVLQDQPVPAEQKASMGCNIKWRAGNEPGYF
jgi:peroxiredoxin